MNNNAKVLRLWNGTFNSKSMPKVYGMISLRPYQFQATPGSRNTNFNRKHKSYDVVKDIWDYARSNNFLTRENENELLKTLKSESDIAIHILKIMNMNENLNYNKISPLYFIASKSQELMKDKFFWLLLSGITVGNRIIQNSRQQKDLCIIAYSVSRLPSFSWVNE